MDPKVAGNVLFCSVTAVEDALILSTPSDLAKPTHATTTAIK